MTDPGRISLACASFDDAPALARLLQCCCGLRHVDEFVVLDHRSRDGTRDLVTSWQARYAELGIPLRYEHEARDLSRHFTLADLLTRTFACCRNEIAFLLDADFVIGDGFVPVLELAGALLRPTEGAPLRHLLRDTPAAGGCPFRLAGRTRSSRSLAPTPAPWLQAYEQGALNGLSYGWTPPVYLDEGRAYQRPRRSSSADQLTTTRSSSSSSDV